MLLNVLHKDIHKVSDSEFKKLKGADIVSGGFPCQAFSYAGKKLGFKDTRGTLFYEFARAVKIIKPKICLAENVRGLISHDGGKTLKTIICFVNMFVYQKYKVIFYYLHYHKLNLQLMLL